MHILIFSQELLYVQHHLCSLVNLECLMLYLIPVVFRGQTTVKSSKFIHLSSEQRCEVGVVLFWGFFFA